MSELTAKEIAILDQNAAMLDEVVAKMREHVAHERARHGEHSPQVFVCGCAAVSVLVSIFAAQSDRDPDEIACAVIARMLTTESAR